MPRRANDPYGNFRFVVELGSIQVAGFAECAGLQMETKIFEYNEGGRNHTTLKFPEVTTYGNITLKRGITFSTNPRAQNAQPLAIVLQDEQGETVKRWNLIRALPVKWVGPDLKANSSEVAIETLEIAHEGIEKG